MNMHNFNVQQRVKFRHTGELGTIVALLGDDLVSVRLDSDPTMTIPAFVDDLTSPFDATAVPSVMGKIVRQAPPPPPRRVIKATTPVDDSAGVQIVWEPMPGADDSITRYMIWLVNPTQYDFICEFDLYVLDRNLIRLDDFLSSNTAIEVGTMLTDDLNDAPEVEVSLVRLTTAGEDDKIFNSLRIKAKAFFKHYQHVPILGQMAHAFVLFEHFNVQEKKESKEEDLQTYTKRKVADKPRKSTDYGSLYEAFNPEAYATFSNEIDLHIQALVNGHARIDPREVLRIQLQHFDRYMDRAIRLGVPRVFIIHGVGEGKLRDALAQRLRDYPHVKKFKNEFHHKYGYGATEVIFD
jgi:Smr domain